MSVLEKSKEETLRTSAVDFDAIVVGTGFGGLRMMWELKKRGLSAQAFEAGANVGGTWYWNRYPGARTDSEAWVYCYSFDKGLLDDWDWPERYPKQSVVESYLQHVADRFELRKDIAFNTRVISAIYDERANVWTIGTDKGETFTCTFFISATGLLHVANEPPFKGLNNFKGEWYVTSNWPRKPVSFEGKRVAVIGTGATGVQLIPIVAQQCEHLTVFQRTANYVIPGRNHTLEDHDRAEIKRNYPAIWEKTTKHVFAFGMDPAGRVMGDVTPEKYQEVLDAGWEAGGFRYLFDTFDDLLVDLRSNELASEFVKKKIRTIVKDPKTAELLCPKDHPFGGKRPPMGHYYYEAFNRDNVALVDISENTIEEITPNGIRLRNGETYELDMIVFALGFDAVTGALSRMNVRGRNGLSLKDKWDAAIETYLGVTIAGFPNMFMLSGPQSCFANIPVVLDKTAGFIGQVLGHMHAHGYKRMEPAQNAIEAWCDRCHALLEASAIIKSGDKAHSWFLGANVPGKSRENVYFYFGGAAGYFIEIKNVVDHNFEGFLFS